MPNDPGQLAASLTLALLLLVVAGLLLNRMLRAIPGGSWVTLPFPGRACSAAPWPCWSCSSSSGCCWTP